MNVCVIKKITINRRPVAHLEYLGGLRDFSHNTSTFISPILDPSF